MLDMSPSPLDLLELLTFEAMPTLLPKDDGGTDSEEESLDSSFDTLVLATFPTYFKVLLAKTSSLFNTAHIHRATGAVKALQTSHRESGIDLLRAKDLAEDQLETVQTDVLGAMGQCAKVW